MELRVRAKRAAQRRLETEKNGKNFEETEKNIPDHVSKYVPGFISPQYGDKPMI